jgi:hypothetical protein
MVDTWPTGSARTPDDHQQNNYTTQLPKWWIYANSIQGKF